LANTIIEIRGMPSGRTGLLLKLFDVAGDTLLNTGGDALTERSNKYGSYTATVTENITGKKDAFVYESDGTTVVFVGVTPSDLADDTSTYQVIEDVGTGSGDASETTLLKVLKIVQANAKR
jgi:hypothetical protein